MNLTPIAHRERTLFTTILHSMACKEPTPLTTILPSIAGRERTPLIALVLLAFAASWPAAAAAQEIVELGDRSLNCLEDRACINRIHPAIPMAARARPGETIVLP